MTDRTLLVGQKLVAGFEGTDVPEDFAALVRRHKVGNVLLFKRNIESAGQLSRLCASLRALIEGETGRTPFIAVDQEGGVVSRLGADCTLTPSAMALAAGGGEAEALEAGRIVGCELAALGVNMDLAPVLDVNSNPRNPVIGVRSFGGDPERAAKLGAAFARGVQESGVVACAKHFPGHGDTDVDSHLGLPRIGKGLASLERCELVPFRAAIESGVGAVMSAHILFPALDADVPATMSARAMSLLLRARLSFEGLTVSDCLMMDAVASRYGTAEAAVAACAAGVDLLLVSHSPALAGQVCEALEARADDTTLSESAARIAAAKQGLRAPSGDLSSVGCAAHREAARRMFERAVTRVGAPPPKLGERPLFAGCPPLAASRAADAGEGFSFPAFMAGRFGGKALVTGADPDAAQIEQAVRAARESSCAVLGTVNAHLKPGQRRLMDALAGTPVQKIFVALRDPYDLAALPEGVCGLACYDYAPESLRALALVLEGRLVPSGRLPVALQ